MESIEENNHVFVYGSLKRGYGNHHLLETSLFLGEGTTNSQNFFMISYCDAFPGVVRQSYILEDGCFIQGEIYKVNDETLKRLDTLEGNGIFYQREIITIKHNMTKDLIGCWMYLLLADEKELEYFNTKTNSQRIDIDPETKICNWV